MPDVSGIAAGIVFGYRWRDDAGKYLADIVKENLVVFFPVEGLDHRAAQSTIAAVLFRVRVITNAFVAHIEIGVDETGFR